MIVPDPNVKSAGQTVSYWKPPLSAATERVLVSKRFTAPGSSARRFPADSPCAYANLRLRVKQICCWMLVNNLTASQATTDAD